MMRLIASLTGDRASDLAKHTSHSRKKVIAIGTSLLLVSGIWFVIGYLMGSVVMGADRGTSLVLAAGLATVIFVVDRGIILVKTSPGWTLAVRVPLALLGAYLGTIGTDQAVFDADIRQVVAEMRSQRLLENERTLMLQSAPQEEVLREQLATATSAHAEALGILNAEMDGTGRSSGQLGYGRIAQQKAKATDLLRMEMERAQAKVDAFEHARDQRIRGSLSAAEASFQNGALLERMIALETFLDRNPVAFWKVFVPLFIFLLIVELVPLLIKLAGERTAYEEEIAVAERLRYERAKSVLLEHQRWSERERKLSVEAKQAESYLAQLGPTSSGVHRLHVTKRSAA